MKKQDFVKLSFNANPSGFFQLSKFGIEEIFENNLILSVMVVIDN